MPGGGSNKGDGSSVSASSKVSTPVAVEVGSLQPFQVKSDPHSVWRKWKRGFQLVKGSQTIRRNVACYFTQLGLTYRKFISHWCLMVQRRTTPKPLTYWMIILFQKLMYLLKDICFGKSVRVVRKRSITLFAGSDNEPLRVSLENGKMSTSEIN